MKSTYLLSLAFLSLSFLVSTSALAAPNFSDGINVYTSQDGGVYTTTWTAYPMTIEGYTGANLKKLDNLLIALTADGKTSSFRGVLSITCSNPISSNIVNDTDYKSLKEAMADYTLPRPVVNNLFAKFCK
ncbi:hypothetical protein [uncultured Psychrobacter sp.]|uniref:hypothetical protein n=1 Tax=uncultured Psychrobacter sp. TaxID=259303 RepID=UPI00260F3E82|nr:hypothetical protein [uncultured Psychrobacter sp.]